MPRGTPNQPKTLPPTIAPLIIIQPGPDACKFTAVGCTPAEAIDELRRILLHLAASQSGVAVISHTIAHDLVVMPKAILSNPNGATSKPKSAKRRSASSSLADFEKAEIIRTGGYDIDEGDLATYIVRDLLAAYAPDISQDYSQLANSGVSLTKTWGKVTLASVVEDVLATGDSSDRPLLFAIWEPPGARVRVGTAGNLLPDPECEEDDTYWEPQDAAITWVTTPYNSAGHSWKFPEGISNGIRQRDRIACAASTDYVTEHYVYWTAYASMTSRLRFDWYDAGDSLISTTYSTGLTSDGVTTGWQWCREVVTSPANAVEVRVHAQGVVGSGGGAARYLCIDDVRMYLETSTMAPETKGRAKLWARDLTGYDYTLRTADVAAGVEATTTTRDLANAVIASYGSSSYTAWTQDTASQALYRRRDKLLSAGSVALADAESQRDVYLARHGDPGVELGQFTVHRPGAVRTTRNQAVDPARLRAGDRLRIVDGPLAGAVVMLSEVRWRDGSATCRPESYEDVTRVLARVEV